MTTSAARSGRRRMQLLMVATVLLLSLGMGVSGRGQRQDGDVTLSLQEVVMSPAGEWEASFLLRNDSSQTICYASPWITQTQGDPGDWLMGQLAKVPQLAPGGEVVCKTPIPSNQVALEVKGYLAYLPRPSLRARMTAALRAWVKTRQGSAIQLRFENLGINLLSDPFVPQEWVPEPKPGPAKR